MFARRVAGRTNLRGIPPTKHGAVTPLTIIKSVAVSAWWRADLGITLNTGKVSAWADQSGNGHTLAAASNQPTYVANDPTLNNLATVSFSAASSNKLASNLALGPTACFISIIDTTTYTATAGVYGDQVGGGNGSLLYLSGAPPTLSQFNGLIVNANNGAAVGKWTRIRDNRTNQTTDYLRAGPLVSTGAAAGGSNTMGFGIGSNSQSSFWTGSIRELIVCAAEPTPAEFAALDQYFMGQCGFEVAYGNPLSIFGAANVLQSVQSDLGVTSSGGKVSAWADQSGNNRHYTQATGSKQPALTAGLNGNPGILFDGVDDLLTSSLTLPAPGTTPTWIGVVMRVLGVVAGGRVLIDSNGQSFALFAPLGNTTLSMYDAGPGPSDALPFGTWECTENYYSNSASDYIKRGSNAAVVAAGANSLAGTGGRSIGNDPITPTLASNVEVLHVIYVSGTPTPAQISAWRAWVAAKYGASVSV